MHVYGNIYLIQLKCIWKNFYFSLKNRPWRRDDSNDMLHFPIRKIFSEIFDFKPANFQKWPGKIRLGPNKSRDVKSGTEVILLVSICYKSILFGAAYEHKYDYECKIPSPCIVLGCSNTPDPKSGIILHKIPYDGNSRPEAIKRHKRWVDFVKHKHAKLEPSSSSWYTRSIWRLDALARQVNLPGQTYIPWLKKKMRSMFHRSQHCSLHAQAKATNKL